MNYCRGTTEPLGVHNIDEFLLPEDFEWMIGNESAWGHDCLGKSFYLLKATILVVIWELMNDTSHWERFRMFLKFGWARKLYELSCELLYQSSA